jgi:hypothetical protein
MLAASCGGSSEATSSETDGEVAATTTTKVAATSGESTTTEPATTTTAAAPQQPENAPDLTGLEVVTFPALGGVRLGIPDDVETFTEGDYIAIRAPGSDGKVVIARTNTTLAALSIRSIDDFLAGNEALTEVTGTSSGDQLEVFGLTLDGYEFVSDEPVSPRVFAAQPGDATSNTYWGPVQNAKLFLAELPRGVLSVGMIASTTAGMDSAQELLDQVLPTAHLTTISGSIEPNSPGDPFTEWERGIPEPVPSGPQDSDAIPLTQAFTAVEPGSYQLINSENPTELAVPKGWNVMPNFPGFVVLADEEIEGPGDRDLTFMDRATAISPMKVGLKKNGALIPLPSVEEFTQNPPPNLDVTNVDTAEIGTKNFTRFDLSIAPMATCQKNDPCAYVFSGATGPFQGFIKAGFTYRVWWSADGEDPLLLIAGAPTAASDWFETELAALLDTVSFG